MTDANTRAWIAGPGNFLCQICLDIFPISEAYEDANGDRWDICAECGKVEG